MNFEDMPINEQFFSGFDKQTLKISHPWPREAEDRVNQLLGQVAAKELECQRLREVAGRMVAGIDHLDKLTREWEPDHSSGADRRGWLLAKDARDDAAQLLGA